MENRNVQENEKISPNTIKGWILKGEGQVITFRVQSFSALVQSLIKQTGPEVANQIMYEAGLEVGRNSCKYSPQKVASPDEMQVFFDKLLTFRGWGRCMDVVKETDDDKLVYEVTVSECPLCHPKDGSAAPACHLLRGTVTGWLETRLGQRAIEYSTKEGAVRLGKSCIVRAKFEL